MTIQAPIPQQSGALWDALAPRFDEFTTSETMRFGETIVDRAGVTPGTTVLDVAAGSGALAIVAARRGATVTAVDIAPTMIELLLARAKAERLTNVEGMVMDSHALDLADDTYDVSLSLHGVSVIGDLPRGLAEMARVTRPGGRVVVGAFGALPKAEFITYCMGATKATVPGFVPLSADSPPPPFRLADPAVFHDHLREAGLSDVSVETVTWAIPVTSASHLWNVFTSSNPIGARIGAELDAEQQTAVQDVLAGMLRERSGGEPGAVLHTDVNIGIGTA